MKTILSLLFVFLSLSLYAQEKFYTKSGTITFESSVPTFEKVKATNTKVTAILKDDGTIASLVLTKAFRFKVALMEEHFNENYIESDNFPKATFSGKIVDFKTDELAEEYKNFLLKGTLNIHGIAKEIEIIAKIKKNTMTIHMSSSFKITPEDFNIEIPSIVRKKIAKEVDISFDFELNKK